MTNTPPPAAPPEANNAAPAVSMVRLVRELDEILFAIARNRPEKAYLGRAEMKALKDRARQDGCSMIDVDYTGSAAPIEYCGVPIYEVLAESHVGYIPTKSEKHGPKVFFHPTQTQ